MNAYNNHQLTSEEYISCVRQLAVIIHKAMDNAESSSFVSDNDRQKSLQRLADGVETIACLRGDNGLFISTRPEGLNEYQKEMYQIEDELRIRLKNLGYEHTSV